MSTRQNDAAYKLLFAHPDMVAQLIRGLIPDPWIDRLDFQTLRPVTGDLNCKSKLTFQHFNDKTLKWKKAHAALILHGLFF